MGERERQQGVVAVGLEKVLYLAAIDPAFRAALLADREAALVARGLELQASELAMLRLATPAGLAASIDALDTSEASLERRRFMRAVAGAVTLAAGSVLSGCGEDKTQGIRPDGPEVFESGGIRPGDLEPELHAAGGIRPDLYEARPPEARPPEAAAADGAKPEGGAGDAKKPSD